VTVPGSPASESMVPRPAARIKALKAERQEIEAEVEELADSLPLLQVSTSMPGVRVKTASQILLAAGDFTAFKIAGHLAAYAGIAPVTRQSGTSIRCETPSTAGNKRLKNTLFHFRLGRVVP
jgi:transposase